MNATGNMPSPGGGDGDEPAIILLCIQKQNYYVYKGDEYLNQLLLVDGEFPKPILCVNFDALFDANRILGEGFSLINCWAVHPEIVARLRAENVLIETDG